MSFASHPLQHKCWHHTFIYTRTHTHKVLVTASVQVVCIFATLQLSSTVHSGSSAGRFRSPGLLSCVGYIAMRARAIAVMRTCGSNAATGMGLRVGGLWQTTPDIWATFSTVETHGTRWNWLMGNSPRSCPSSDNTLRLFVSSVRLRPRICQG